MKPIHLLNVDEVAGDATGLVVRSDEASVTTEQIMLPQWHQLAVL